VKQKPTKEHGRQTHQSLGSKELDARSQKMGTAALSVVDGVAGLLGDGKSAVSAAVGRELGKLNNINKSFSQGDIISSATGELEVFGLPEVVGIAFDKTKATAEGWLDYRPVTFFNQSGSCSSGNCTPDNSGTYYPEGRIKYD
jgi:hypothetical protein